MPFAVTVVLERAAPSETFIRRELEQLQKVGWPIVTYYLAEERKRLRCTFCCCPKGYQRRLFKAAWRRIAQELPRTPLTALRIARHLPQIAHLMRVARTQESRLLHAHFAGITADVTCVAAAALGLPWSCAVHAQDVFTAKPAQLERRLRSAVGITGCSHKVVEGVIAAGVEARRVTKIFHGLPLADFEAVGTAPEGRIFTACRLVPKKGLDTLLRACALLRERGVEFSCEIAGSGSEEHALRTLCASLGLAEQVRFSGWLSPPEVRKRIADATVVVLPSRKLPNGDSDGIANILLEAMALGRVVVTTTAGAAAEVVVDRESGILVAPDDAAALAQGVAAVLGSGELRERIATTARKRVKQHFDIAVTIPALEHFLTVAAGGGQE